MMPMDLKPIIKELETELESINANVDAFFEPNDASLYPRYCVIRSIKDAIANIAEALKRIDAAQSEKAK